jgi:prevent-host-death family protein
LRLSIIVHYLICGAVGDSGQTGLILLATEEKEVVGMIVSSTEVQNDFKKYVDLASEQDIVITRDGLPIARLLGMKKSATLLSERLVGLVPHDVNEESAKTERLARQ